MKPVTASLVIIGNEILSGRTQDKNLAWLAAQLNELGIRLMEVRVVPDIESDIIEAVNAMRAKHTYVFTTGGIGPTHDDITTACIAKAFGLKVISHPEAHARLEKHYEAGQLNAARLKMADTPEGATLIDNPVSAAPGFRIGNVFVFAGVPAIMQAMFASMKHELSGGAKMNSRSIAVFMTEGNLAAAVSDIQTRYPQTEIGSYPFIKGNRLGTSIVVRSTENTALDAAFGEVEAFFRSQNAEITQEP